MVSLKNGFLFAAHLVAAQKGTNSTVVVKTDVVVVGGGGSGAHAAVRLTDYGQDVILIEKQSNLGGAVDSYTDPSDGKPSDFGVASFTEYGNATGFFARFNIPITNRSALSLDTIYADFSTGQELSNYTTPSWADQAAALERYNAVCEKYEDMIVPGLWNFPNASSIPEDFLLVFSDFVEKYNLTDALPLMWETTGLGMGSMLNKMTLPVIQGFNCQMARVLLGSQNSLVPASGRNQDLYDAIAESLGDKMYLNTTVIASNRSQEGISVTVRNSFTGEETLIQANKLLIAIQPVDGMLAAFDLDEEETAVFSKMHYTREYSGVVSNPSLPLNSSIYNFPYSANDNTQLHWKDFNFTSTFVATEYDKDLFHVIMVGDEKFGPEDAKSLTEESLTNLVNSGVLPKSNQANVTTWLGFSDHGPMHDRVSGEDLKAGFYQDLYALMGRRATWYTGGAWASNYQTVLWEFNESLLPLMLAA